MEFIRYKIKDVNNDTHQACINLASINFITMESKYLMVDILENEISWTFKNNKIAECVYQGFCEILTGIETAFTLDGVGFITRGSTNE